MFNSWEVILSNFKLLTRLVFFRRSGYVGCRYRGDKLWLMSLLQECVNLLLIYGYSFNVIIYAKNGILQDATICKIAEILHIIMENVELG